MTEALQSPDTPDFEAAKAAQAQAAHPAQSAWVEANAGSGKTKVLIDRVARLLLRRSETQPGARPDSILCITYTKAAANEMLARLYKQLGDWAVASNDVLRDSLAMLEGRPPAAYQEDDFREARRLFARALETPGGLRIETIHAFCARILRRFPLEAGVAPGFAAIEEDEANSLWRAVLAAQLEHSAERHPEAMTCLARATGGLGISAALEALKFQRQALTRFVNQTHSDSERTERIRQACNAGPDQPDEILRTAMAVELPIAAIRACIANLASLESPKKADLKLLTALRTVIESDDPGHRYDVYMSALAGANRDFPGGSDPYTKVAGPVVVDLFSRNLKKGTPEGREITRMKAVQTALRAAQLAERSLALMQVGLPLVAAYAQEKRKHGALDFDDLIARTSALLTQSSAAEWVLFKLDGGLSHLLLDEAQDTSPQQWTLINALVEEFQSGQGRDRITEPRTQFVVGDSKQSIYSFQGADQQKYEAEHLKFVAREEAVAAAEDRAVNQPEMAMSFRSTPEILTFVDEVRARIPLSDSATDPLPPVDADLTRHAPRRANQPGRVELWPLELPLESEDEDAWTTPTDHVSVNAPRRRLARSIARRVREMLNRGDAVWRAGKNGDWKRRPIRPEDVLILVRSRNELFEALIESLKQEGIPVAGADRLRLLDNLGVQDCLNLIRFALQPGDDLALAEILRGPFCGLVDDDRHLFILSHGRASGETVWDRLSHNEDDAFATARAFCQTLLDRRDLPAFEFLTGALTARDPDGLSGWDKLIQRLGEPVRDPVQALVSGALSHDMREPCSLQAYLARVEGQNTVLKRELGDPDGAVRVMTVHGAKGLQSPVVILPDTTGATKPVSDAIFFSSDGAPLYSPSSKTDAPVTTHLRDAANAAAERESRRLLYVALTRAADYLIIAGAGTRAPKIGYAKSSWYRWCLTAMRALAGEDPDTETPPETLLAFGADPITAPLSAPPTKSERTSPDWLTRPAPSAAPPLRLAAPSRLTEDRSAVLAPFGPDRKAALRRGRLIHGLLQTLPEIAPADREAVGGRFLARAADLSGAEQAEMLSVTLRTLEIPAFAHVFGPGGRSEAAIVGALPGGQMVNGRVDRLIIGPDQILIIDYKTDRPAPETAAHVEIAYWVQMAAYRAVLQTLYPDRTVACALLYTDGPRLIELPGRDLSESLKRVESRV